VESAAIHESPARIELLLEASPANLRVIRRLVSEFGRALGADDETVYEIASAVNEAATNVVVHAYEGRTGPVRVVATGGAGTVVVSVADEGLGETAPTREATEHGRGLPLMRSFARDLEVRRDPFGTRVQFAFSLDRERGRRERPPAFASGT
jgi:serine/threonine-protein kinase RsbW